MHTISEACNSASWKLKTGTGHRTVDVGHRGMQMELLKLDFSSRAIALGEKRDLALCFTTWPIIISYIKSISLSKSPVDIQHSVFHSAPTLLETVAVASAAFTCWQWCIFDFVSYITNNKRCSSSNNRNNSNITGKCQVWGSKWRIKPRPRPNPTPNPIQLQVDRQGVETVSEGGELISEFLFFDCDDCALKFDTFQPVRGGMLLLFFFLLLLHAKMLASRQGIGHANGQELLTTLIRLASAARSSNVISHQPKWADYET